MVGGDPSPHDDIMERYRTDNPLFVNEDGHERKLSDFYTPPSPKIPVRVVHELPNDPIRAQKIETELNTEHNRIMEILCTDRLLTDNENCGKWRTKTHRKEYNTNNTFNEMKKYFEDKARAERRFVLLEP